MIGLMNMILDGIAAPNYLRTDALADWIADFEEKDCYTIILANPNYSPDFGYFVPARAVSAGLTAAF